MLKLEALNFTDGSILVLEGCRGFEFGFVLSHLPHLSNFCLTSRFDEWDVNCWRSMPVDILGVGMDNHTAH